MDTELLKPAAMRGMVVADGAGCIFRFHGIELWLPAKTARALKFLSEQEGVFTARQIPDSLRESEVLVLVRRLIVDGFLRRRERSK